MEVYAQRLKRVHSCNWKTNRKRYDSQTQRSSFFKYSPVIKAFLAGLTCDVLRARLRQAADKRSLTLIGFLELHHDNITKSIQSTNGPLFLVYPKHDSAPDLSQWNSRLLCTVILASNCVDEQQQDDIIYLRNMSKRYFHNKPNGEIGNSTKLPQSRREWTQLFKIVQRLVESVNDVNLIRQVRNFICKIEMEACKQRTRKETHVRLESLISDMIADRIQPQHKKNQLTEEAIHEFKRQLISLSYINTWTPKMFPKLLRPQSASVGALKTSDQHETNMTADTNKRPNTASVQRRKSFTIKKTTTNVKRRPLSAHTLGQNSRGKSEQHKRPSSAYVGTEKQRKPGQEETRKLEQIRSVSRKPLLTESDHKDYSYIGTGRNKHRVIIMYKERLKNESGNARISSPPVVKHTKAAEPITKTQSDHQEKPDTTLQENNDKTATANTTEANTCMCRRNETTRADWHDMMKTITNEVLVHQNFHKAVTNPLLENNEFVDDFLTYLKQNHVLKQFLRARSTDHKQCFKLPHGRSVQLSFFLAFVSRHIEPKLITSAQYMVQKLLHRMKCKDTNQSNRKNSHSSSNCLTRNQKLVKDENKESVVNKTEVSKREEVHHTETDLKALHNPGRAKCNDPNDKTTSNNRTRSQSKEETSRTSSRSKQEKMRHANSNNHNILNRRGTKADKTIQRSEKRSPVSRSSRPRGGRTGGSSIRSRSGSSDRKPGIPSVQSRSGTGSLDRKPTIEHETATVSDNDKEITNDSRTYDKTCCWRCSQKEDAMNICINWGNKQICDLLLAEGVPYHNDHLIAAVNANDLDALTAIVDYLKQKQCWNPECNKARLALQLAIKYRMQSICAFLKTQGVSLDKSEKSPFSEKRTCSSCFIT